MAKPLRPYVRGGGFYPSRKYTPLVYPGGYTTRNASTWPHDPLGTFSGAIARFHTIRSMPIKSLKVDIKPKQDLHGYDSPWPAGGGKNKLDPSKRTTYSSGQGQRWYEADGFTLKANQAYTFSVTYPNPITLYIRDKVSGSYIIDGNGSLTYTPTEDIVVYFQAYRGQDISSVDTFQLELGSTATSFQPYSNICPISGWSGVEVWDCGTNIGIVKNLYVGGVSGTSVGVGGLLVCFSVVKGQTYRISGASGNRNNLYKFRGDMDDIKPGASMSALVGSSHLPYVVTADETCIYCYYRNNEWSETIANAMIVSIGDTATDYEPYQGNSYSVTWSDEVFGAEPDLVSGEMPVTSGKIVFDGTQPILAANWQPKEDSVAWCYYYDLTKHKFPLILNTMPNFIASSCAVVTPGEIVWGNAPQLLEVSCYNASSNIGIIFRTTDMTLTTVAAINAYLAANPITLAYELAEPIPTSITPTPINTLKGYNAVWADAGHVEVTAYGTPIVEPDVQPLQAMNLLLGGAYRNNHTPEDVSDEEALNIITGGADR